jgi:transposase
MEDAQQPIADLPDDLVALKRIIANLAHQRDEASRQRDQAQLKAQELEVQKLRLEVELLRLKKWYYGPRADKLEVGQLLLQFAVALEHKPVNPEDLPRASASDIIDPASVRRVRRGRRDIATFERLPVLQALHDLNEDQKPCPCCGKTRQKIGQESTWQIEHFPSHFARVEHVQIRYACKHCEKNAANPQITLSEKPLQPIERGMAGPGLLAYVITSKFADHLPLYRLESIFQRHGFEIDRSTMCVWAGDVADLVKPLYQRMIDRVLASHLIGTDDTVMPMLAPEKTRQARMWIYQGDEDHPYNIFDFTLSRSRDGPARFLKNYNQVLLADAYGGYDGICVEKQILQAGCWSHARRKFVDAQSLSPAIAAEALRLIGKLFAIEQEGKHLLGADRLALRQSHSLTVLQSLHDRLLGWKQELLPKHPMAEAIGYVLNQWQPLTAFATDGAIPIHNNLAEQQMKRIALGRKNYLFVGNERGGRTAAILSSLTSTCRRHEIDPQVYLTQLLANLPSTSMSQLDHWLPDVWKRRQDVPQTPVSTIK